MVVIVVVIVVIILHDCSDLNVFVFVVVLIVVDVLFRLAIKAALTTTLVYCILMHRCFNTMHQSLLASHQPRYPVLDLCMIPVFETKIVARPAQTNVEVVTSAYVPWAVPST